MDHGVTLVLQRIQAIEERFSPRKLRTAEKFQDVLDADLKRVQPQTIQAAPLALRAKSKTTLRAPADITGMIAQSAHKYGVDPKLVDAVARAESNYLPDAVSDAGAVGIMQLMPATASSLGVANPYDPRDNIEGGTKYIKQLLNTFGGDVSKAVAAYNAGPQAVKNYNGVPPYDETQNYVRKVLDLYR